ncbi:MAG: polyphosphate kinase 1 [Verrucomicrobiales bacterium]|nr:polyphosphate kinase 1 [Verrucomicrobiales bacterium]
MGDTERQFGPDHFLNRELSWLEFNQRVLDEALNSETPLLERVKFFSITSSNLDEFFEVRVAGLKQQIEAGVTGCGVDGMTPAECLESVTKRVRRMVDQQFKLWRRELLPALEKEGIQFHETRKLKGADREFAEQFYRNEVHPVLTPLSIDPAHPFPQLLNKSLNIMVQLNVHQAGKTKPGLAVVQVPRGLQRLVRLPREDGMHHVFLANLIGHFAAELFPGNDVLGHWSFRVTRNSELYIEEADVANLLMAVEEELRNRRKNAAVRLEVDSSMPNEIRKDLLQYLQLNEADLYPINGPINPIRLMTLYEGDHSLHLRDEPHTPRISTSLRRKKKGAIFDAIRRRDILLHHPYESFGPVVDFLAEAADDPNVLAIKQTLYRTGGDMRVVGSLIKAARNGKQVTAVVELRARFDEANNIQWARHMEEEGVHVVYGLVGYKIHSKATLVVRRDEDGIRRYLHLGTGNYNPSTARLYTDLGLLTCDDDLGEDIANLFNLLTGVCQFQGTRKLLVAPFELHERMIRMIERERENASRGLSAHIVAKMNSLVDPEIISALYRASQAGVKIDLIVRGICCLKPGLKGVSDNIHVRSIVDRFLEHSRVFYFENALQPELYVGSADWMPRNFFRRIETVFPVEDGRLRDRILNEIVKIGMADNSKARILRSNGAYRIPAVNGAEARRSQLEFIELIRPKKKAKKKRSRTRTEAMEVRKEPDLPKL